LEGGNAELKALVAAYLPAFMSLRDCVTSLEKHTLPDATLHEGDSKESKVISIRLILNRSIMAILLGLVL
jgi:hypothetical protein